VTDVKQKRILVVDDELAIRLFIGEELSQAGYEVLTAASGEEALTKLQTEAVDLVLLDLMMRGVDGLDVMKHIVQQATNEMGLSVGPSASAPAVIMLTAHASVDSAVDFMRQGGLDYLIKPCRTEDLLISVERALARRAQALQQQELIRLIEFSARQLQQVAQGDRKCSPAHSLGPERSIRFEHGREGAEDAALPSSARYLGGRGLLLDWEQRTVTLNGQPIHLTPTEFSLLRCLMEQADQVVSPQDLMRAVHGHAEVQVEESRQALNTHLWRLRKKIAEAPDGKPYIVNVRGQGYKFISQ
jgi:DNA-binding response OmpR family regulator